MPDVQPLNLNTAFYEESISQTQAGEVLLCACASLTCLLPHSESPCSSMLICTAAQISSQIQHLLSSNMTVVVRGHKVTVLILTFSEFENYSSKICPTDELQPEPETQPGATVGAPPRHRTKRKKVLPSFLLVTCSASHVRLRPRSHDSVTLRQTCHGARHHNSEWQ